MSVFENRVVVRMLGPKKEDAFGYWVKLHDVDLHNLYSSRNTLLG